MRIAARVGCNADPLLAPVIAGADSPFFALRAPRSGSAQRLHSDDEAPFNRAA